MLEVVVVQLACLLDRPLEHVEVFVEEQNRDRWRCERAVDARVVALRSDAARNDEACLHVARPLGAFRAHRDVEVVIEDVNAPEGVRAAAVLDDLRLEPLLLVKVEFRCHDARATDGLAGDGVVDRHDAEQIRGAVDVDNALARIAEYVVVDDDVDLGPDAIEAADALNAAWTAHGAGGLAFHRLVFEFAGGRRAETEERVAEGQRLDPGN